MSSVLTVTAYGLKGADVNLFLLESYGRIVFSNAAMHAQLKPSRDALAAQIASSGMQVVSAFVASTTFGGGSELAQLALLSGINTGDPLVHDLLLTTQRPTLITAFRNRGYETLGVYPEVAEQGCLPGLFGHPACLFLRGVLLGFFRSRSFVSARGVLLGLGCSFFRPFTPFRLLRCFFVCVPDLFLGNGSVLLSGSRSFVRARGVLLGSRCSFFRAFAPRSFNGGFVRPPLFY